MHDRRPAVREPGRVPRPAVSAVVGSIDPAAGRDPDPRAVVRIEIEGIHGRVEDHPVGDTRPRTPAVARAKRLPVRAGIDRPAVGGIESERLDEDEAPDADARRRPGSASVAGKKHAVVAAAGEEIRIVGRLGEGARIDGSIPSGEDGPLAPLVFGDGDERAVLGPGESGPESPGRPHVDPQGRNDVSRKLVAAPRGRPGAPAVDRMIDIAAGSPAIDRPLPKRVDRDRRNVRAEHRNSNPATPDSGRSREGSETEK